MPSAKVKEIDRQIKEAQRCANSPYITLDQQVEAIRRVKELQAHRLEIRRQEIIENFEKES